MVIMCDKPELNQGVVLDYGNVGYEREVRLTFLAALWSHNKMISVCASSS